MKPWLDGFVVVTASSSPDRDRDCIDSWTDQATYSWEMIVLHDGRNGEYSGSVPKFADGVRKALGHKAQVIACLHSDLRIDERGWDKRVWEAFQSWPLVGLLGFGGAKGLGAADIYRTPYQPQQLARQQFLSNMKDAEAHGERTLYPGYVSCLDGFSQIGNRAFWEGKGPFNRSDLPMGPLDYIEAKGVKHHAYDSWLGVLAKRLGWEVLLLPVACHHFGGRVAVGDQGYAQWAAQYGGDGAFWDVAHKAMYEDCRNELPLRII